MASIDVGLTLLEAVGTSLVGKPMLVASERLVAFENPILIFSGTNQRRTKRR